MDLQLSFAQKISKKSLKLAEMAHIEMFRKKAPHLRHGLSTDGNNMVT